jgi:hypothetical protein
MKKASSINIAIFFIGFCFWWSNFWNSIAESDTKFSAASLGPRGLEVRFSNNQRSSRVYLNASSLELEGVSLRGVDYTGVEDSWINMGGLHPQKPLLYSPPAVLQVIPRKMQIFPQVLTQHLILPEECMLAIRRMRKGEMLAVLCFEVFPERADGSLGDAEYTIEHCVVQWENN